MISPEDQKRLRAIVARDWEAEVGTEAFRAICAGRERGHRIADYAEERTLTFLESEGFDVAYQHGKDGNRRSRSMGDVWIRSGEPPVFTPVNVKAGIAGVGGQPNMVSLSKVTDALLKHEIDSYWLLLIRLVEHSPSDFRPGVTLINIFDYLDFMHFDSGPGQIMLKSDSFYAHLDAGGEGHPLSIPEAIDRLIDMRRDGDRRLVANRNRKLKALEDQRTSFQTAAPMDQSALDLRKPTE